MLVFSLLKFCRINRIFYCSEKSDSLLATFVKSQSWKKNQLCNCMITSIVIVDLLWWKRNLFFALVNFFTIVKSCMERKENELSGWVCHSWYGIYSLVTLQKLCKYCSHPEWFLVTVQIFEIHIRPQNLKNIQLSFDIYLVTSKIREIFFSNFCGLQFKHHFHSTIP